MLLSSGAPIVLPPFLLLAWASSSLFLIVFFSGGIDEGGNEGKESVCGGEVPARLARSSDGDVRSPRNNGISGTDLPPIYYENKQHGVPETWECLVTIYKI